MLSRVLWVVLAAALVAAPPSSPRASGQSARQREGASVQRELDRIGIESLSRNDGAVKSVSFTEAQVNDWVAYRIEEEKEDILRELAFKLLDDNRIEGKALVDLRRAELPWGLKPLMNLYFAARIAVQDGFARLDFETLFIEGQQVPMLLLETIISAAAGMGKSDAAGIREWTPLPLGIKNLRTQTGRLQLFYEP